MEQVMTEVTPMVQGVYDDYKQQKTKKKISVCLLQATVLHGLG